MKPPSWQIWLWRSTRNSYVGNAESPIKIAELRFTRAAPSRSHRALPNSGASLTTRNGTFVPTLSSSSVFSPVINRLCAVNDSGYFAAVFALIMIVFAPAFVIATGSVRSGRVPSDHERDSSHLPELGLIQKFV